MAQQTTAQPGQADGFGQKVVHPLGQTTRPVLRHGIGRQRYYGNLAPHGSQAAGCFQPVHLRHSHIHQDEVRSPLIDLCQRLQAIACKPHPTHQLLQHERHHQLIDRAVLHHQHIQIQHGEPLGGGADCLDAR